MTMLPTALRPRIVLVGAPGAGKSTVGPLLADLLGVAFRDTDHDVEAITGMPIADLFVERGEPYFRDLEAEAVHAALASHPGVLSLGGGAILRPQTRAALAGHTVGYLRVDLAEAARRVGMNAPRPLLLGNVRAQLNELFHQRTPLYEEVATITVDAATQTAEDIAGLLAKELPAA
ncbi:MAG TPA: shikimate kinase [Actinocrinis sp.]|nr:shikimate kinase [Actinocrinis sp.]